MISQFVGKSAKYLTWIFVFLLASSGISYLYFIHAPAPPVPEFEALYEKVMIHAGNFDRSAYTFTPSRLAAHPPLLLVFHGSTQDAGKIRVFSGYEFDRLAWEHGFITAYPEGYENYWNDCRSVKFSSAKKLNIDDVSFIKLLIEKLIREKRVDKSRVFAAGYSNGGQMVFRLALEAPGLLAGVAAIAASMPASNNTVCPALSRAVPAVLVEGTEDPLNPYAGGEVQFFGFMKRGPVVSAQATASLFAARFGFHSSPEIIALPHRGDDDTHVKKTIWNSPGRPSVVLFSIYGGGHVIPQPLFRAPRIMGRTSQDLNAPEEIWNFFSSIK